MKSCMGLERVPIMATYLSDSTVGLKLRRRRPHKEKKIKI